MNFKKFAGISTIILITLAFNLYAASYGGGSGTEQDPYQIWTAEQMNTIGLHPNDWDNHFILMSDIDMSQSMNYPIGYEDFPFNGSFDGNNHVIRNLTYNYNLHSVGSEIVGLFGVIGTEGEVRKLGLENVYISGYEFSYLEKDIFIRYSKVGSLAGQNSGKITDCYATGDIAGIEVGGLVGRNIEGTIINCNSTGSITGEKLVGGLVGLSSGKSSITNCYATVNVTGGHILGGLVGAIGSYRSNPPTITNCYATGDISGWALIGGLIGDSGGTINNCYSTGGVDGEEFAGGLVGSNRGLITNCYSTGNVKGEEFAGGLVGYKSDEGDIIQSFWDVETSGISTSDGGIGLNTSEIRI